MSDSLHNANTETTPLSRLSGLHNSKIKHEKYPALWRKKQVYWYYRRLGYYAPYFSGRRGTRLRNFFFYRRTKRWRKRLNLTFFFFHFLRNCKRYTPNRFLKIKTAQIFIKFIRYQFAYFKKKKKKFFWLRDKFVAAIYWVRFLLKLYTKAGKSARYFLPSAFFFLPRKRLRLRTPKLLNFKNLHSTYALKKSSFISSLRKRRRTLRSLFHKFYVGNIQKIFFITLRSSKNNTMLSVFDFLGNLLYWKTSKAVGMSGKKKSTKMAAEFLAYHLVRYLRSRKFYSYKFIFTLFGLRRHFRTVFRFVKKSFNRKRIVAMINKSQIPHGGCYIKKRKHKGRKKYRRRTSLYY